MILVPREAQNLLQTRFSCMLVPFSMFLFDSGEGKVLNSPLYEDGKQSDDFGRSSFSLRNVAVQKRVQENLVGTHFC